MAVNQWINIPTELISYTNFKSFSQSTKKLDSIVAKLLDRLINVRNWHRVGWLCVCVCLCGQGKCVSINDVCVRGG